MITPKQEADKRVHNEIVITLKNQNINISESDASIKCLSLMDRNFEAVKRYQPYPKHLERLKHLEQVKVELENLI